MNIVLRVGLAVLMVTAFEYVAEAQAVFDPAQGILEQIQAAVLGPQRPLAVSEKRAK